ncbi:hypothetical protein SpCBS45565_g02843 [Spizellomyces sp. 'palustris']|nr:hypothetical protein SpCBS45565_g02843 [Spizellomyces sp. 'palustris']
MLSAERVSHFTNELLWAASNLDNVIKKQDSAVISVAILSVVNEIGDDDGLVVAVEVQNHLPQAFTADELRLCLTGGDMGDHQCRATNLKVEPGANKILLTGEKITISGTYTVGLTTLQIGKLQLEYRSRTSFRVTGNPVPVRILAGLPDKITFGEPNNSLQIKLFTGHQAIKGGSLVISALTPVSFPTMKSVLFRTMSSLEENAHAKERTIDTTENRIVLPACEQHEMVTFYVPFSESNDSRSHEHKLRILVDYTTEGDKRFTCAVIEKIDLSPSFDLNYSITYSPTGSLLQYVLKGNESVPIRILQARVDLTPNHQPVAYSDVQGMVVFHSQAMPLLYKLEPNNAPPSENTTNLPGSSEVPRKMSYSEPSEVKLQLTLNYYSLKEELEAYLLDNLGRCLVERNMAKYSACLAHFIRESIVPNIDYLCYAVKKTVSLPPVDLPALEAILNSQPAQIMKDIGDFMKDFSKKFSVISAADAQQAKGLTIKTLVYHTESPLCKVLLTAKVSVCKTAAAAEGVAVSKPLPCCLRITSAQWQDASSEIPMSYEIAVDHTSWMFSGKRKQAFTLKAEGSAEFPFTLIPVKTGRLLMPQVTIRSSSTVVQAVYPTNSLSIHSSAPLHAQIALGLADF